MSEFLLISPEAHFNEVLQEAIKTKKVKSFPFLESYLVQMLKHYVYSQNLYRPQTLMAMAEKTDEQPPQTLAETYLWALNHQGAVRRELMKELADKSLYVAGFFGDSLNKKLVDIEYYSTMGSKAYSSLATLTKEDHLSQVYKTFSMRFKEFVDVLGYISEKSQVQANNDIMSLYDKYLKTGSESALEKLNKLGVHPPSKEHLKVNKA